MFPACLRHEVLAYWIIWNAHIYLRQYDKLKLFIRPVWPSAVCQFRVTQLHCTLPIARPTQEIFAAHRLPARGTHLVKDKQPIPGCDGWPPSLDATLTHFAFSFLCM